ncbi:MAG TPA: nucleotidyltransferase domain-containing protein [Ignavibacteria bacterium]|nr:nucleotidyltransferase domain-containing protein [Ignavibacteria bacterium]
MTEPKLNFGITDRSFELIRDSLAKFTEIDKAIIFGSRAIGNEKSGSDIDIAVFGKELTDDILRTIKILLNEKKTIPYFVDIIDYNSIENSKLKEHINNEGKIFWIKKKNCAKKTYKEDELI